MAGRESLLMSDGEREEVHAREMSKQIWQLKYREHFCYGVMRDVLELHKE